ncbi:MAG: hypothetical protein PHO70_07695 [Candidatus Omnitrophica bacterium]|nr:hypothetical protein [Candidatus Omnitrophota bacterium]
MLSYLSTQLEKYKRKKLINLLKSTDPESLLRFSEKNVLATFQRAAIRSPAYSKLLAVKQINPASIKDIKSFIANAPFLDKVNTFQENEILDLCLDGNFNNVKSLLTSSGHSGIFSFGVNTNENLKTSSKSIDFGLNYTFNIDKKKSLLINCLPMGVKVNTSLTIAETSTREDMVWAVIKKFSHLFEQTVLVGEGSFLKKIIEDGADYQGINWKKGCFSLITGEEGIAENYRNYIAHLMGIDLNNPQSPGIIGSSMGVAELDLNIFHETKNTMALRRLAHTNQQFREALFGKGTLVCPMLFVYYPHRTYIEEIPAEFGQNHIVISMLSKQMKIPLLRYKTGDLGKIIPYNKLKSILSSLGLQALMPELKLPLISIFGRGQNVKVGGISLFPEEVKEAIYSDFELASQVTGAFKLIPQDSHINIFIQLRKGKQLNDIVKEKMAVAMRRYSEAPLNIIFYTYNTFPYFMEVDYERKFSYA